MTPEELSRIRRIYEQALPLAGSAREKFLKQECEGADEIRAEIERLLSAHENIPSWLEPPVWGPARTFADLDPPKLEGRRLGGYTLIREIGRGGMGSVYLAERSDEMFHRRAAVKLILPPAGSAGIIARFQQEREILASLDHPNIAKLLDAGVTEEGWPYFVMEFVDGRAHPSLVRRAQAQRQRTGQIVWRRHRRGPLRPPASCGPPRSEAWQHLRHE